MPVKSVKRYGQPQLPRQRLTANVGKSHCAALTAGLFARDHEVALTRKGAMHYEDHHSADPSGPPQWGVELAIADMAAPASDDANGFAGANDPVAVAAALTARPSSVRGTPVPRRLPRRAVPTALPKTGPACEGRAAARFVLDEKMLAALRAGQDVELRGALKLTLVSGKKTGQS